MTKKTVGLLLVSLCFLFASSVSFSKEVTEDFNAIPVKGTVTMIDLGAHKCIPCKMMEPIIQKLEKAYEGKADIIFIDVWKHRDQAQRFQVHGIPTQIFFDKDGKEIYRHVGFLDEASIVKQMTSMGVPEPAKENTTPKG